MRRIGNKGTISIPFTIERGIEEGIAEFSSHTNRIVTRDVRIE